MPCIALLTDFGTRDPYLAVMKGVIVSRCSVPLFDLTHDIEPFDVFEAAWFLRTAVPWWPPGTIFVAVVDPGVGTERKLLACERAGRLFLAPDNGLLTFVCGDSAQAVSVENESLFLPDGSTTFHGRDRLAPVAAALANGVTLDQLGEPVREIVRLDYAPPVYAPHVRGTIVSVDRFGNLITDVEADRIGFDELLLMAKDVTIDRHFKNYALGGSDPFLIIGSTGCVEISVGGGSAADVLHLRRGDRVEIRRRS
ncbi:MAG TPA: SAM-dependent chlorinase/fluorinase [Thermoanaerobaculia bacterium]|nr:SAM-dependent chlorinase/fluorinase [Thermoanaerobaculia bacterium]